MIRLAFVFCIALPALGDDAALVAEALKTPPETESEIEAASKALERLVKRKPEGLSATAMTIAKDVRQAQWFRSTALMALADLPDSPREEVTALASSVLEDRRASKAFRSRAAFVLERNRFTDARARAILEKTLLRPGDDEIVQRNCLRALVSTADLGTLRRLLLRKELHEHPYFGIRIDVCTGLAALNVRDRRALEILCTLMTDGDARDKEIVVPLEAWLSFWVLTGRTHGLEDTRNFAKRPAPIEGEKRIREFVLRRSFLRPGVTQPMVRDLLGLLCKNADEVRASRRPWTVRRVRNTAALEIAAKASKRDIDAIVADWKK